MSHVVGEFFEQSNEMRGEWRIPKFLSLPKLVNMAYFSSDFFFAGSCCHFVIFPNGMDEYIPEGHIALRLKRLDFGPPVTVSCTLSVRKVDGTEERIFKMHNKTLMGQRRFKAFTISRTILENCKAEFLPSEALTVTWTLKNDRLLSTEDSLFTRLWNMSFNYWCILSSSKRTDFVLKFKEGEKRVHRLILEERSPVFNRMLNSDMLEAQTGEMAVDLDQAAFNVVLAFIYCGDPKSLSTGNVREVFKIARLCELPQLARLCTRFMLENLSVNTVCDVIALATLYQETETLETARDFFVRNSNEVIKTEGWKRLKSEQPSIGLDLMETMIENKTDSAVREIMASFVGQLYGKSHEMMGEWCIPNFVSLPKQLDNAILSSNFFFAGFCWKLLMYPNGQSTNNSKGRIVLCLQRIDFGPPITISFKLGVKVNGTEVIVNEEEGYPFSRQEVSYTYYFISRTSLENRKAELLPSGALTITCTLKNDQLLLTEGYYDGKGLETQLTTSK